MKKNHYLTVRITKGEHEEIRKWAKDAGLSVSDMIRHLLWGEDLPGLRYEPDVGDF
jgi:hypothetical protein